MKRIVLITLMMLINSTPISALAEFGFQSNLNIDQYLAAEKEAVEKKISDEKKEEDKKEEKKETVVETIDESKYDVVHLGKLLSNPTKYLNKNVKFRGEFSSFVTLALDYKPAFRSSKEYISFAIFRPGTEIPLSELKMAFPVEKAKDNKVLSDLNMGDLVEMFGTVFSDALGEPWLDITYVKMIKAAPKSDKNKNIEDELE